MASQPSTAASRVGSSANSATPGTGLLTSAIPTGAAARDPDALFTAFTGWMHTHRGLVLYAHQVEAFEDLLTGANVVITTPTGSGKSLIATAGHFMTLAAHGRSYYTAPIKALVSEKFFDLCDLFGADLVGMVTGDASVNPDAPIICCTAEILANIALREGDQADIDLVIADEFHFIADPDRGWAWQVAVTELPQCQFVIMSATLGDVSQLADDLTRRTGRETAVITDAVRPVPLQYSWSMTPLPEEINELVRGGQAPVYIVHPSQAAATDQAQALLSTPLVDAAGRRMIAEALGGFRFAPGFGPTLAKLLRAGIGVHHAGMLPKYRRLVETLAQRGLLAVICGTDTLGVGINLPIRTVLFTTLAKFDGRRSRLLRSREFHQIAGRAGRPGFDTVGYVVAQAPEYQIENARLAEKFAGDERKLRSVRKKKPPEGFVNYTQATFDRLVASQPEPLRGRLVITHALLLNLLHRDQDTAAALVHLVEGFDQRTRGRLFRRAAQLGRSLLASGVVVRRATPTPGGRRFDLAADLQDDFALNQPLSAFAMAALDGLDPQAPDYALNVVSVIEATLEDPWPVLRQQQSLARGEAVAEMKAEGYDYAERMAALDDVSYPQPLAEFLAERYAAMVRTRPWLADHELHPKSVVRDMAERAMTFSEFVAFYKVQRAEGVVLRYLSDAYRALRQTVPIGARDASFEDLLAWLGQIVRMTDSSLLDEWEALTAPDQETRQHARRPVEQPHPVTGDQRAFRVLVRNAMWRRVELCARDDVDGLAALDREQAVPGPDGEPTRPTWTRTDWDNALGAYWDEHDEILTDADARGPGLLVIEPVGPAGRRWLVRQIIDDPAGNHDWTIGAEVDLDACDAAGRLVVQVVGLFRQD